MSRCLRGADAGGAHSRHATDATTLQMVVAQGAGDAELAADPAVSHQAASFDDALHLAWIACAVVCGHAPRGPSRPQLGEHRAGVADIGHVKGHVARGQPPQQRDGGRAAAAPCTKHCELAVDLLEGADHRRRDVLASRAESLQLPEHDIVQLGLAVVCLRPAAVPVVDPEEAPGLLATAAGLLDRQGVNHTVAVLHVGAKVRVRIRGDAHQGGGTAALPRHRSAPRGGLRGCDGADGSGLRRSRGGNSSAMGGRRCGSVGGRAPAARETRRCVGSPGIG
mmetsp:Transcript_67237/g.194429  ORF Transcript_67237/g.194429 Transcript_67237/m.194429 type:complete len:280 (-) Transcript_67237:91-930(-)